MRRDDRHPWGFVCPVANPTGARLDWIKSTGIRCDKCAHEQEAGNTVAGSLEPSMGVEQPWAVPWGQTSGCFLEVLSFIRSFIYSFIHSSSKHFIH